MELFKRGVYAVRIQFKPGAKRDDVIGEMERREYKRMLDEMRHGFQVGTYQMMIENIETELTFPVCQIDTVHAVPAEVVNGNTQ